MSDTIFYVYLVEEASGDNLSTNAVFLKEADAEKFISDHGQFSHYYSIRKERVL